MNCAADNNPAEQTGKVHSEVASAVRAPRELGPDTLQPAVRIPANLAWAAKSRRGAS